MIKGKLMISPKEMAKEIVQLREENKQLRFRIVNLTRELDKLNGVETVKKPTLSRMLYQVVCDKFLVDIEQKNRSRSVVDARRMYYHWLCNNTGMSLSDIGETLKLKHHHSTVIWMRNSHESLMAYSKAYERVYNDICEEMCIIQNECVQL